MFTHRKFSICLLLKSCSPWQNPFYSESKAPWKKAACTQISSARLQPRANVLQQHLGVCLSLSSPGPAPQPVSVSGLLYLSRHAGMGIWNLKRRPMSLDGGNRKGIPGDWRTWWKCLFFSLFFLHFCPKIARDSQNWTGPGTESQEGIWLSGHWNWGK